MYNGPKEGFALVDELHKVSLFPGGKHVKRPAKGHPAHDLDAEQVEPFAGVEDLALAGIDSVQEILCCLRNNGVVVSKCCLLCWLHK